VPPDYGGGVQYWDSRHAKDATCKTKFDWLFEYAHLRDLLSKHIARDHAVLQLGCGNSRLAQEWCLDGHNGQLRNVDYSPVVVEQMMLELRDSHGEAIPTFANLSFEVGDVRNLKEYRDGSFDAVLDKATYDCIACNEDTYQEDLEQMLLSTFRVLRPGGVYLLISCGDPESRIPWLDDEPGLDWNVSVSYMTIRSGSDTNRDNLDVDQNDDANSEIGAVLVSQEVFVTGNDSWEDQLREIDEEKHTFVYICRKRQHEERSSDAT
jgi:SAM-dependent methyltransferase